MTKLVPALMGKDIVTSRPILISKSKIQRPEWGPLYGT